MLYLRLFSGYLPIKLIAEYTYCPRAALYMYLNWENNERNKFLYEGELYHKRLQKIKTKHRNYGKQKRNILVFSQKLKIYGFCDMVELNSDSIIPIEYKSGYPKIELYHKVQLSLQALCLSEMYKKEVNFGFIYFRKTHRRVKVNLNEKIRKIALSALKDFKSKIENKIQLSNFPPCSKRGCSYYEVDFVPFLTNHVLVKRSYEKKS